MLKKEYERVKAKAAEANLLSHTSRTMEDIFYLSTKRNVKRTAVIYIDANGKKQDVKVFNGQGGFVSFISGTGNCSYTLEFYTPYLALGSYISAIGTFVFATTFAAYFYFELKRKEKEELFPISR